jgi:hypothetical protein
LAFSSATRLGSTDVGFVVSSCACKMNTEKRRVVKKTALLN